LQADRQTDAWSLARVALLAERLLACCFQNCIVVVLCQTESCGTEEINFRADRWNQSAVLGKDLDSDRRRNPISE